MNWLVDTIEDILQHYSRLITRWFQLRKYVYKKKDFLKDELGHFTAQFGVEITEVELSDVKVVKEAENMGLASLSAVAKSEVYHWTFWLL